MTALRFLHRSAEDIRPHIDDLASLRMQVFGDFPYLYDGDLEYERSYLETYVGSARSLAFLVYDEQTLVGATTALPMRDEEAAFQRPLARAGFDIARLFYFGESLLLPAYRGRGLGHRFFDEREAWARRAGGFDHACFCSVQRPPDHPLRPADYRPLDEFWTARGYTRHADIVAEYAWQDIDRTAETKKSLVFWSRPLSAIDDDRRDGHS